MQQLTLSSVFENLKPATEEIPDYIKFYSVYQYDRIKFKKLLKREKIKKTPKTIEELKILQKKILKECYIRDVDGKPVRLSDEPHIFRYSVLLKIYSTIFKELGFNEFKEMKETQSDGLIIFNEHYKNENYEYRGQMFKGQNFIVCGASIEGSEKLSLKDRIKVHINFLRNYRLLIFIIAMRGIITNV